MDSGLSTQPQPISSSPGSIGNPYALSGGSGQRSRPQYATNPQMFPTAQPVSMPPMFSPTEAFTGPTSAPVLPEQTSMHTVSPPMSSQTIMPPSFDRLASSAPPTSPNLQHQNVYQPVVPHWFYCKVLADNKSLWCPFSLMDSGNLERAAISGKNISTFLYILNFSLLVFIGEKAFVGICICANFTCLCMLFPLQFSQFS